MIEQHSEIHSLPLPGKGRVTQEKKEMVWFNLVSLLMTDLVPYASRQDFICGMFFAGCTCLPRIVRGKQT